MFRSLMQECQSLIDDNSNLHKSHPGMSDLIEQQLMPGDPVCWVDSTIDFNGNIVKLLDDAP